MGDRGSLGERGSVGDQAIALAISSARGANPNPLDKLVQLGPAKTAPAAKTGGGSFFSGVVNKIETATGLDINGDGSVGGKGPADPKAGGGFTLKPPQAESDLGGDVPSVVERRVSLGFERRGGSMSLDSALKSDRASLESEPGAEQDEANEAVGGGADGGAPSLAALSGRVRKRIELARTCIEQA